MQKNSPVKTVVALVVLAAAVFVIFLLAIKTPDKKQESVTNNGAVDASYDDETLLAALMR